MSGKVEGEEELLIYVWGVGVAGVVMILLSVVGLSMRGDTRRQPRRWYLCCLVKRV